MKIMKEIEVFGIKAKILDAGCRQYRTNYIIPTDTRNGKTLLDLTGFNDDDLDVNGSVVKELVSDGLLMQKQSGYEILFKWHD